MEENFKYIRGLRVYYTIAGDPKNKTIVFLHARGASIDGFNNLKKAINELAKYFYVIAPEHPGLIRSETPNNIWNFDDYAEALHELLRNLKIIKPILVGNSFGGGITTTYAWLYPDEVSQLILIDSVVSADYLPSRTVSSLNRNILWVLRSKFMPFSVKKIVIWTYFGKPLSLITKEEVKRKINTLTHPLELKIDYSSLKVPVTLLWGRSDTKIHPIKYARDIAMKNPQFKLIEYDGNVATVYKQPSKIVEIINALAAD